MLGQALHFDQCCNAGIRRGLIHFSFCFAGFIVGSCAMPVLVADCTEVMAQKKTAYAQARAVRKWIFFDVCEKTLYRYDPERSLNRVCLRRGLLEFDGSASFFEFGCDFLGIFLGDLFLDLGGNAFDQLLGIH